LHDFAKSIGFIQYFLYNEAIEVKILHKWQGRNNEGCALLLVCEFFTLKLVVSHGQRRKKYDVTSATMAN